jgi:hypothetical protein
MRALRHGLNKRRKSGEHFVPQGGHVARYLKKLQSSGLPRFDFEARFLDLQTIYKLRSIT